MEHTVRISEWRHKEGPELDGANLMPNSDSVAGLGLFAHRLIVLANLKDSFEEAVNEKVADVPQVFLQCPARARPALGRLSKFLT